VITVQLDFATGPSAMDDEHHHMDQVLPGFWIGDLHSARDSDTLKANNIRSILTVMRGKFPIHDVRLDLSLHQSMTQSMLGHFPAPDSLGRRRRS
jgi:hypothetical protein